MINNRRWTAEDYDMIETLLAAGLPPFRIAAILEPPSTPDNLRSAMRAAGIPNTVIRGRPSNDDRRRWEALEEEILLRVGMGERVEASKRAQIERLAERFGYDVVITPKAKA